MDEYDQSEIFADDNSAALSDGTNEAVNADWDDVAEQNTAADSGENADRQDAAADNTQPEAEAQTDRFELKHLDEKRSVSRQEVIALAQKGLDYDRIRAKYDALRADQPERAAHEALLQELAAGAGQSVDQLLQSLRAARTTPQEAALPHQEAQPPAEQPGREAQLPAEQAGREAPTTADPAGEAVRQRSYLRFAQEFPGVRPEEIPAEIWRDFAAGRGDLADLYARHENRQLRAQLAVERQNEENRRKSTGSRATAGSAMSKLDADWYDGT